MILLEQDIEKKSISLDQLPAVRGEIRQSVPLAKYTWFKVGGPAQFFFKPEDVDDLQHFIRHKPQDLGVTMLGVGSNLLIRDGGLFGVTVRLGRNFTDIQVDEETHRMIVGAGVLDFSVAKMSAVYGIGGLEFLSGIPGTIGGGIRMNAGAYGREMKDVIEWIEALDSQGNLVRCDPQDLKMTYRHCDLPKDWIFLRAALRGYPESPDVVQRSIDHIKQAREDTQPVRTRTGGSTFTNPNPHKAWQLIDQAECRGLRQGDAVVSDKHCNFLINLGGATAGDIESLGEEVRRRVRERLGVELQWEIHRIGVAPKG